MGIFPQAENGWLYGLFPDLESYSGSLPTNALPPASLNSLSVFREIKLFLKWINSIDEEVQGRGWGGRRVEQFQPPPAGPSQNLWSAFGNRDFLEKEIEKRHFFFQTEIVPGFFLTIAKT